MWTHYMTAVENDGDLIIWAANRYLFVYNQSTKDLIVKRNDKHTGPIRSISRYNGKTVTGGDDKKIILWNENWEPIFEHTAQKKVTKVIQLDDCAVYADRYGDVYELKDGKERLLLGHLAIVSEMKMVENNRYIVTADNNNQIRISRYPQSYVLSAICHGHDGHITKLLSRNDSELISISSDHTLRIWDIVTGDEKQQIALRADGLPIDAVMVGSTITLLYQNDLKLQRIDLEKGTVEDDKTLSENAVCLVSPTRYINTKGHLKSTDEPELDIFNGLDEEIETITFEGDRNDDGGANDDGDRDLSPGAKKRKTNKKERKLQNAAGTSTTQTAME